MNPVVTIGICVKNTQSTIREAVSSILNQDFPYESLEVIVVDGFSQDKTVPTIMETFSKTSIRIKFFKENKGLGFARQMVVDNAEGKYILWVDGDVILSKTYVQQQAHFMDCHPQAAIAMGRVGLMPNENWVAILESIGYVVESLNNNENPTSKLLGTRGSILRVEAIRRVGGFDPIMVSQEDTDVAYRLRSAQWKFFTTKAMLYEKQKTTLREVWKRHFWYGYGLHFLKHKHKGHNMFSDKTNDRIIISSQAYKLTHRRMVFLLPLDFILRKIALVFGFLRAHFDGYGHNIKNA
jgi:glycosyltransferase involved in cell wall biosynthesis